MSEQPISTGEQATEQAAQVAKVVDDFSVIDLDAERKNRAAKREGKNQPLPIRIGGDTIATLPVELPIDYLEPLRGLDQDLTIVLRSIVQSVRASDQSERLDEMDMIIDVLAANPALPVTVLDTITEVAKNVLTVEGFGLLMSQHPSAQDLAALAKGVFRFYGVSLGESLAPSGSSTGSGETSKTTSSIEGSTSETSTPTPGSSDQTADVVTSGSAVS